ncbi:hypothetical protein C2I17_17395 [Niallia circulans]|uniref:hypothetical protein n=1 Tax=Niallia circulans TaxID=1397 RepID=UPI00201DFE5B|nr:hypothetical protein [Niallia circulans]UQZ76189.1 hypothetical protein C2I17_17395 [Niallia circulans]
MFILQFVDAYTQEIIREETYDKEDFIFEMIDSFHETCVKENDIILFDNKQRILDAKFISHKMIREADRKIYKLFFVVILSEIQAPINNKT